MGRHSSAPDDLLGKEMPATYLETTAPLTAESPSLAFLRALAHASDQPPNTFDIQLAVAGDDAAADAPAFPSKSRFLVRKRLGAGGFGIVYEAFDRERNATVALKVLRRTDGRSISRFKKEFRSLVETAHENLVQLYELHAEGDAWFFTMELVRGEDALSYVRPAGGPCDEPRLRAVFRQIAAGLSFLHRSGKLHRDVKPSNVLVTGDGRVVVVDFGLVSDLSDLQAANVVCGTPAYMAPELTAGLPASPAADWYAVGVMLYEAFTGRLPFADRDSAEAFAAPDARPWPPPPPSALDASVPEDLDRLCADLLARVPSLRPTGREVRRRLAPERRGARGGGRAPELAARRALRRRGGALHRSGGAARRARLCARDGGAGRGRHRAAPRPLGHGQERSGAAVPGGGPRPDARAARALGALLRAGVGPVQGRRRARRRSLSAPP